jgi:MFS family permease
MSEVQNAQTTMPVEPFGRDGQLSRRAWGALLLLCGALFLDALDVSMVGVALPSIRNDLHLSTTSLQWVVSAYVLGYGGFLLLGGRVADLLGRRRAFLVSLGVFVVASGLGGIATTGSILIATRFVKGMSAAFTAPAGLSIITTSFPEGPARNRALTIYSATGATGFSAGLVFGGLLTEIGWRYVFFLPVVVALVTLVVATRLVPPDTSPQISRRHFDMGGAALLTSAMLLLVFTLVEAPTAGWASGRTLGSLAGVITILTAFTLQERRSGTPLVRLGILRSSALVRANLGAMSLFGGWVGFQFIAMLYMQQLRGWSPLDAGLAVFPAGLIVAILAPRVSPLVDRFGATPLIGCGLGATLLGYLLFLPIGVHSLYVLALLPTFLLGGIGFGLAYGPLNIAATNGIAAEEQGLAGGLLNTSFQFGGALVLAVVTAVNAAASRSGHSAPDLVHGFRTAALVSVVAAAGGVTATVARRRSKTVPFPAEERQLEPAGAEGVVPLGPVLAEAGARTECGVACDVGA